MILDSKIKAGKKPLTCFDIEEAKKHVGKPCFISNNYEFFCDLDLTHKTILKRVKDCQVPFYYDSDKQAEFCLPCEWVKEPEKKYRPYTLAEWIEQHEIGDIIHFRCKEGFELRLMYLGTRHRLENNYVMLTLGDSSYSLSHLFENYEIEVNGEWQPFGRKVETIDLNG